MSAIPFPTLKEQLSFTDCCGENPEVSIWEFSPYYFSVKVECLRCGTSAVLSGRQDLLKTTFRELARQWDSCPEFISRD